MHTIVVINPKGGCGKSTIAMNLAGFFACWGVSVGLVDLDPQESCLDWLRVRPQNRPRIEGWRNTSVTQDLERKIDYQIIDVPSSCFDSRIQDMLLKADTVIIPLLPSINDFRATRKFLSELEVLQSRLSNKTSIGFIANRIKNNTKSFIYLKEFVRQTQISCHGILRDTQNYIRAAEGGLSIFELPRNMVNSDLVQWRRTIRWLCFDQYISVNVPLGDSEGSNTTQQLS
jgi:chromosome partitioning protein